ncbi:hypothetical protein JZM10_10635 [Providencia rettgeri]|nr:hypothetical protein [Providencia rettgeri]HEK2942696.1 hypothetical protein [Proteus mirabilis]
MLIPSKQGDLDCLCGIYSLVNMSTWFYGDRIKPRPLFNYLLREYSEYWSLYKCLTQGIDIPEMDYLIKRLASKYPSQAPLRVTTPFRYKDGLTTQKILSACQAFLGAHTTSRRIILLGDQWHWSLVERMDSDYLYFFDSHQQDRVSRTRYGLRGNKVRRLYSESIYWVEISPL